MSTRPGAIFDLDGTLLDSYVVWNHLADWLLGTQGLPAPPGLKREVAAMSLVEAVDYLKAQYGLRGQTSALVDACNGHVRAAYEHTLLPMPGAAAYVARLQRQGVRLCVATASDASLARAALARLGMLPAIPQQQVLSIGNASWQGAYLALSSRRILHELEQLAKQIERLDLNADQVYAEAFLQAMNFDAPA